MKADIDTNYNYSGHNQFLAVYIFHFLMKNHVAATNPTSKDPLPPACPVSCPEPLPSHQSRCITRSRSYLPPSLAHSLAKSGRWYLSNFHRSSSLAMSRSYKYFLCTILGTKRHTSSNTQRDPFNYNIKRTIKSGETTNIRLICGRSKRLRRGPLVLQLKWI